jgi:hypothetical protein
MIFAGDREGNPGRVNDWFRSCPGEFRNGTSRKDLLIFGSPPRPLLSYLSSSQKSRGIGTADRKKEN